MDNIANIDNTPSTDYTLATLDTFTNTAGQTAQINIEGVAVTYTTAGTGDQATNTANLITGLTANNAALAAQGVTFSQSGNTVILSKSDFSASNAANDIQISLGGSSALPSTLRLTTDAGSVGDTDTLGESRTIANGAVALVNTFSNPAGETISLKVNGTAVSFTAAGTGNQSGNATAMANAINAASIANVVATAVGSNLYVNDHSGGSVTISEYRGSDEDVSSFQVASSGAYSVSNPTGSLEEGPRVLLDNFLNTSGETISIGVAGVPVSFTAAGTASQATNATRLLAALNGQAAALSAAGVAFQLDDAGTGVIVSRQDKSQSISITDYEGSTNDLSSMQVTHGGDNLGTATSNITTLSDGTVAEVQSFHNQVGETISFDLSGISLSFTGAGTGDQATNASRFYAALETQKAALEALGYRWDMNGSNTGVFVTRNGALGSETVDFTNYVGSTDEPTFMALSSQAFSVGGGTLQEGYSFFMGGSGGFTNTNNETISFNLAGQAVSFTAAGTGNDVTNATRLYTALQGVEAALNTAGYLIEYTGGDDKVRIISKNNQTLNLTNYLGSDTSGLGASFLKTTDEYGTDNCITLCDTTVANLKSFSNTAGQTISFDLEGVGISFTGGGNNAATNTTNLLAALNAQSGALNAAGIQFASANSGTEVQLYKTDGSAIDIANFAGSGTDQATMNLESDATYGIIDTAYLRANASLGNSNYTSANILSANNTPFVNVNDQTESSAESTLSSISVSPDTDPTTMQVDFSGYREAHFKDMTAGFTITAGTDSYGTGAYVETNSATVVAGSEPAVEDAVLTTQADAQEAITIIHSALNRLGAIRADIGGFTNRVEATISYNETARLNAEDGRRTYMDADMAEETATQARAQIREQMITKVLPLTNFNMEQLARLIGS